jgi:aspartokinase/homoserine dehydrogenase 1
MGTLTMKFGGTSVGSPEAIGRAADIVLSQAGEWDRLAVVVSAMNGVTDLLIRTGRAAEAGNEQAYTQTIGTVRERQHSTIEDLVPDLAERQRLQESLDKLIDNLSTLCIGISILRESTPRAMDAIASLGERLNARVVAAVLRGRGLRSIAVDATELIVTDDKFGNAAPVMEETRKRVSERLVPIVDAGTIPVITGFIGATPQGVTTTLGRGGSDYSAAILGDCMDSDAVWTLTDVDGVMTADPRIVEEARVIPVLSYSEVSELAFFGAKVLHPKTILPIVRRNIPLWVKNTFDPDCPGTCITRNPETADGRIKAVTAVTGVSMVTVEGRGMLGVPGIAARTFSAVASQGASVLLISQASSEQSICFVIPTDAVPPVVAALEEEMARELARRDIDRIWSLDDMVIVTAVGAGLRGTPGVSARLFGALGKAGINVVAIAQGSSECSLSLVLQSKDAVLAVRRIHQEVIADGG